MTPADFIFVAQMLRRRSGLMMSPEKAYLLHSRLAPVVRRHNLPDLDTLVARLKSGDEPLACDTTEAMTTNETYFFRDTAPFEQFENTILPAFLLARASQRRLRIWCAAASTGQEPYSLAMLLHARSAQLKGWKIDILGTDLSSDVLSRAREGLYSQFEVQRGLPVQMLIRYFEKEGDRWRIRDDIRAMVEYRLLNLLDPLVGLGTFDIVFCRNVLIYFDEATKRDVLERIARLLPDDGYLALGASETLVGVTGAFAAVESARGFYVRNKSMTGASATSVARDWRAISA